MLERGVPQYSAVVPVGSRVDDFPQLLGEYIAAFDSTGAAYEIIVVLDGRKDALLASIEPIASANECIRVVELSQQFGESAALSAGFEQARADILITLPAYYQIHVPELPKLLAAATADDDMLIAVRSPRYGTPFDRARRAAFHGIFTFISGMRYRDLGCGVRLIRRNVVKEIPIYADQQRFFPALASRRGFRVREVELAQSPHDRFRGRYRTREYLHRLLDILTVFFLVRFTKKPLRFFGTVGFIAAGLGGLFVTILVAQRLIFGSPLADRPALLLASLLIVLGVQTFALGLIGELVIFTHAAGMKEYAIRRVIHGGEATKSAGAVALARREPAREEPAPARESERAGSHGA